MINKTLFKLALALVLTSCAGRSQMRTIKNVEPISLETPQGTVARLPWQVRVTYTDGRSELRQTVWTNHAADVERTQADASRYPAGSTYSIEGFITGDNTTPAGYPISATVKVTGQGWNAPAPQPIAESPAPGQRKAYRR